MGEHERQVRVRPYNVMDTRACTVPYRRTWSQVSSAAKLAQLCHLKYLRLVRPRFWFANSPHDIEMFWKTRMRFYVDGEAGPLSPAIDFLYYPALGIGSLGADGATPRPPGSV